MAEKEEKKVVTPEVKTRKPRRPKKQVIIETIEKTYETVAKDVKTPILETIKKALNDLEAAMPKKTRRKRARRLNIRGIIKDRSEEEIKALIEKLQKRIQK